MILAAVALSAAVFIMDLVTPYGWAGWLLYLIPLLLVSPVVQPRTLAVVATSYTVLASLGLILSPAGDIPSSQALFSRSVGLLALWSATLLLLSRKRVERRLLVQSIALGGAPDSVALTDADGRIIWVNAAFTQLTGHADDEVIGTTLRSLESGTHEQAFHEQLWGTIRSGQVWSGDLVNRRKDGTVYTAGVTITPLYQRGVITQFIEIQQDITERIHAEEMLRASEIRYRRLFEAATDGILIVDAATGRIVDVNPFLVDLLGFSHQAFLGKKIWELGFFENVVANEDDFKELRRREHVRYEDKPLSSTDGQRIDVEFVSNVHLVSHQEVIQCNIRDIRGRKRADAEHAHLAAIVDSSDEAIVSATLDGTITSWNRAAARLYGYSPSDIVGRALSMLIPRDLLQESRGFIRRLRRGESIEQHETVRVRKDGTLVPISSTVSPILSPSGAVVGVSSISRDISARKQAEAETEGLISDLEHASRVKADFMATMSHELRTPLNIIMGYNNLLLDQEFGPMAPEQTVTVQHTQKSAQELLELITSMLAINQLETGPAPLSAQECNLGELLQEIREEATNPEKAGVPVVWEISPGLPRLHTDRAKLKIVIKTLCANGVKFSEHGHVTVRANAVDGGVELVVADTGIGIAPDVLPIIFEPFRQGDGTSTRRYGGSGLGLYIVQRYVEVLGATIHVDSALGQGSTFRVLLPLVVPPPQPVKATAPTERRCRHAAHNT